MSRTISRCSPSLQNSLPRNATHGRAPLPTSLRSAAARALGCSVMLCCCGSEKRVTRVWVIQRPKMHLLKAIFGSQRGLSVSRKLKMVPLSQSKGCNLNFGTDFHYCTPPQRTSETEKIPSMLFIRDQKAVKFCENLNSLEFNKNLNKKQAAKT